MKNTDLDNNLGVFEKITLVGALALAMSSGYLLYNDHIINQFLAKPIGDQVSLGKVISPKKDVRHRFRSSLLWYQVVSDRKLFQGDSVFTGEDSSTRIELDSGLAVDVQANSLLVLGQNANELTLDLKVGQVVARKMNNAKFQKIALRRNNKKIDLELAGNAKEVNISSTKSKDLSIVPVGGDIKVKFNDKIETIGTDEKLKIDEALQMKKVTVDIRLDSPVQGAAVSPQLQGRVPFYWSSNHETSNYTLEVAEDYAFKTVVARSKSTDVTRATLRLPDENKYFWRVVASGEGISSSESPVGEFKLVTEDPVKLIFPTQRSEWAVSDFNKDFDFVWSEKRFAESYEFQLSKNSDFSQVVNTQKIPTNVFSLKGVGAGNYFWRVRYYIGQKTYAWSIPYEFTVEGNAPAPIPTPVAEATPPPAPKVETPEPVMEKAAAPPEPEQKKPTPVSGITGPDKVILKFSGADPKQATNPPVFKAATGDAGYTIEFSRDSEFKKIFSSINGKGKKVAWKGAPPGNYYWRMKSPDRGTASAEEPNKLRVHVPVFEKAKTVSAKKSFKKKAQLKNAVVNVDLKWPRIPGASGYKVKVAGKKLKTKTNSVTAKINPDKHKSFVVFGVNSAGQRITADSKPIPLNVTKNLLIKRPRLNYPENNTKVVSIGSADEFVIFDWEPNKEATKYVLQFSKSAKFDSVMYEHEATENNYVLDRSLPATKIYWRVQVVIDGFKSPWSKPRVFRL